MLWRIAYQREYEGRRHCWKRERPSDSSTSSHGVSPEGCRERQVNALRFVYTSYFPTAVDLANPQWKSSVVENFTVAFLLQNLSSPFSLKVFGCWPYSSPPSMHCRLFFPTLAHLSLEAPVHRNLRFLASIPCDQVAQVLYLSILHYDGRRSATLRSTKVTSRRSLTTLERQLAKIDQNQQLSQPCCPPSQSEALAIQDFHWRKVACPHSPTLPDLTPPLSPYTLLQNNHRGHITYNCTPYIAHNFQTFPMHPQRLSKEFWEEQNLFPLWTQS